MRAHRRLKWLAIFLTLLSAAAVIMPVHGQDAVFPSLLTILPIGDLPVGTPIAVTAQLSSNDGGPNPNKVLSLYLNDELVRRIRTNDKGLATIRISQDLLAGDYTIRVDFAGTQAYLPSSASTVVKVRPAVFTVQTIPPLADIPFSLGGEQFKSDKDGIARFEVSRAGDFPLEVLLNPDTQVSPDTRVTFDRWQDEFQPQRTVTIDGDVSIEAGFSVSHPVSQTFVDLDKNPVEMDRIQTLTLQGTDGSKFTFDDGQERWLRSGRIARRQSGLEATKIMYSVESVMINGSNTVNRYQQRFFVEPKSVWSIQLLLYHATFTAADAVFGFPVGTGLNIKYPDGHTEFMPFGKDNAVYIGPVPRGEYKVQVMGASGMAPETPLALSRDQHLDLKVLSTLNIGLGGGLGMFVVFGLLLYGRPYLPGVVFRATRDVATLRFLKSGARKRAQLASPQVQYLLPETTIPKPVEVTLAPPEIRMPSLHDRETVVETEVESDTTDVPVTILENMEPVSAEPAKTFTAEHVGQLGAQDTYYVGSLEGIGEIYQQTYVDVYSNMAFVKLYTQKDSQAAVDMLENVVLPWFKRHDVVIEQVMTDRGREYTGAGLQKNHLYQMALASSGIKYVKNGSDDPQSNVVCTPVHQMVRALVYKKALRKGKKKGVSLQALQRSVDKWLIGYNSEHLHRLEGQRPSGSSNGEHGAIMLPSPQSASD